MTGSKHDGGREQRLPVVEGERESATLATHVQNGSLEERLESAAAPARRLLAERRLEIARVQAALYERARRERLAAVRQPTHEVLRLVREQAHLSRASVQEVALALRAVRDTAAEARSRLDQCHVDVASSASGEAGRLARHR